MKGTKSSSTLLGLLICIAVFPPPIFMDLFPTQTAIISVGLNLIFISFFLGKYKSAFLKSEIKEISRFIAYPLYMLVIDYFFWHNSFYFNLQRTLLLINIIGFITMDLYAIHSKDNGHSFIKSLDVYLTLLVITNAFVQLVLPNGTNVARMAAYNTQSTYILSNLNNFGFTYIAAVFVCALQLYIEKKSYKKAIGLAFLEIVSLAFLTSNQDSITSLICICGILVLLVIEEFVGNAFVGYILSNLKAKIIFVILAFVGGIISLNSKGYIDLNSVPDAFKSLGLRVEIWQNSIKKIFDSPIIGHGVGIPEFAYSSQWGGLMRTSHNTFLQVLYYGGIIGFVLYLKIFFYVLQKNYIQTNARKSIHNVFLGCLVFFVILFLFEQKPFSQEFFIFLLAGLWLSKVTEQNRVDLPKQANKEGLSLPNTLNSEVYDEKNNCI